MFIRHINLPKIPTDLIKELPADLSVYTNKALSFPNYIWSETFNQKINQWCKENICPDMYWGFQIITGDLLQHKDNGTKTKFNYLISTGGDQVITTFYDDDQTTVLYEEHIPAESWHIFKADSFHDVKGINKGAVRFCVTGRIF